MPATALGVSDRRDKQPLAIEDADYFYDPAVSGADPIETRPGFSALPNRIEGNGVRTVIVEDTSRFARALVTQELGFIALLKKLGVRVLTASGNDLTVTDDPMKKAVRQIAGVFAELERHASCISCASPASAARLRTASAKAGTPTGKSGGKSWRSPGRSRRAADCVCRFAPSPRS